MDIKRPESNQPLPASAKKVFQGHLFGVYQWQQEMYDGTYETFEKLQRRDTVGVIAITTDNKIVLTHQEQPGMKPFIGTPGGIVDEGEEPFPAIQRELLEETGYESNEWSLFDASQPTTKIDWAIYTFIAKNCRNVKDLKLDAGEKIKVIMLTFDQFITYVKKPEFRDKELALKILRHITAPNGLDQLKKELFG